MESNVNPRTKRLSKKNKKKYKDNLKDYKTLLI